MAGSVSSHTASIAAGTTLGGAVIGVLVGQFHVDAGLATDWLIIATAVIGGPVLAYVGVKAKDNPALAAALNAILANQQQGNGHTATETTLTATATTTIPPAPETHP